MTIYHHIDNSVPDFGEWDSVTGASSGVLTQTPDANWPEQPGMGLRIDTAAQAVAHADKSLGLTLAPGQRLTWTFSLNAHGSISLAVFAILTASARTALCVLQELGNQVRFSAARDPGGYEDLVADVHVGCWHRFSLSIRRASAPGVADGEVTLWQDGVVRDHASIENYNSTSGLLALTCGNLVAVTAATELDIDDLVFSDDRPSPGSSSTDISAPSTYGTILLIPDSEQGYLFGEQCAQIAGVPRANILHLPGLSTSEQLASYSDFQQQVETPLAEFFSNWPDLADRCCCFLLGPGVPGSFLHEGVAHSTASRLMRFGQPFVASVANPLICLPLGRLDPATLRSHGIHLAARIDGPTFSEACDLLHRGVDCTSDAIPQDNRFCCDDGDVRASLAAQALRLDADPLDLLENDAITWTQTDPSGWGEGGARALFADLRAGSLTALRTTSDAVSDAIHTRGYAAGVGSVGAALALDPHRFLTMLHLGATLAEAAAVSSPTLDDGLVLAGYPMATPQLPRGGATIYRGRGSIRQVDWSQPVAYLREGQTQVTLPGPLDGAGDHVLAARRVSQAGLEEQSTHVVAIARIDEDGQLLPPPLPVPADLSFTPLSATSGLLHWTNQSEPGFALPDEYQVLAANRADSLAGSDPVLTVPGSESAPFLVAELDPLPEGPWLAVRAVAQGRAGRLSKPLRIQANPTLPAPASLGGPS